MLALLAVSTGWSDDTFDRARPSTGVHSAYRASQSEKSSDSAGDQDLFRLPPTDSSAGIDCEFISGTNSLYGSTAAAPFELFAHKPVSSPPRQWFDENRTYSFQAVGRSYFINDQRIEWSGLEATFGAEAALLGSLHQQWDEWQTGVQAELFLNQRFGANILADTPERISYRGNFDIDPFEISQLFLSARNGDFLISLGKMTTPFGRAYFPLYQNNRQDAPFIRTESILWRETGLLLQYDPGIFVFTAAMMNGSEDQDTNSSKAFLSRIGIETDCFALGASVKWQDGIGSEDHKIFNNHIGADVMIRRGRCTLSGEVIYDEYGFRRNFNPNNITWGRSIYYRDQFIGLNQPISGVGCYVNLDLTLDRWSWMLNVGAFNPESIGDPRHDVTTRRGIIKAIYRLTPNFKSYTMVLIENNVPNAQDGRLRRGFDFLSGFQIDL